MTNNRQDYWKLSTRGQEYILFKPIMQALQDNGGELENNVLKNMLPSYDARLDLDEVINKEFVSDRGVYTKFNFKFNFARKNLIYAGFVTYGNKTWRLTPRGLSCDVEKLDADKDIYAITMPMWVAKRKQNAEKRLVKNGRKTDDLDAGLDASVDSDDVIDKEIIASLRSMNPYKFEAFSRGLLSKMGITMSTRIGVNNSNDGGIDGFGVYTTDDYKTTKVAIQCKRFKGGSIVGSKDVDALRGSVAKFGAEYGIFIATAYFSRAAKDAAISGNIPYVTLIDAEELVMLMKKYEYFVKKAIQYEVDERLNEL